MSYSSFIPETVRGAVSRAFTRPVRVIAGLAVAAVVALGVLAIHPARAASAAKRISPRCARSAFLMALSMFASAAGGKVRATAPSDVSRWRARRA